jgi:hypothetical protein
MLEKGQRPHWLGSSLTPRTGGPIFGLLERGLGYIVFSELHKFKKFEIHRTIAQNSSNGGGAGDAFSPN